MLIVKVCLMQGFEMLRLYPLGMALVRRKVGPNLTAKERRSSWLGLLHSLEDPPNFYHAKYLAPQLLFFMVYFVYATLAPVINFFLSVCFLIMECGYRFMFIHNHPPKADSGGKLWKGFIQIALGCMIVSELFFVAFLILKESTYATPLMAPLIVCSGVFVVYLHCNHFHVSNYVTSFSCMEHDNKNQEEESFDFVLGKYLQPCLINPTLYPDRSNENIGNSSASFHSHQSLIESRGTASV